MTPPSSDWKTQLDLLVAARHGGRTDGLIERLRSLDSRFPQVPEIAFQLAWTLDTAERPADALPHYERAIALGLEHNLPEALIGLANCLRLTGQPDRAVTVLEGARRQFPHAPEFAAWLALSLHHAHRPHDAFTLLLDTLLDHTDDIGLAAHQRALRHHTRPPV